MALGAFALGSVFHFVSIVEEGIVNNRCPIANFYETLSMCAFLFVLLYLFVQWRYKLPSLSVFVFPLVFVMALVATLGQPGQRAGPTRCCGNLAHGAHRPRAARVSPRCCSPPGRRCSTCSRSASSSSKKPSKFYYRLPALGTLDDLISRSMAVGFVLMTLAVIAASTWASIYLKTEWIGQPKIVISFFTWGVYLALVFLRTTAGWRGRKAAIMTVTVLGFSALTWAAHARLGGLLLKP